MPDRIKDKISSFQAYLTVWIQKVRQLLDELEEEIEELNNEEEQDF